MNNIKNYQILTESIINNIISSGKTSKLLLHSCCAPCSSYVLEYLSEYFQITVLYYNPNIDTIDEYNFRSSEQQRFIKEVSPQISFVSLPYDPKPYYEAVKGLENLGEGSKRCFECFRLRLSKTAEYAANNNYDYFTTTLSISPLKKADVLNEIGKEMSEKYNVEYLFSDFKKKGGYLRSIELSKKHGIYRQDYCGCEFSKKEREKLKKTK